MAASDNTNVGTVVVAAVADTGSWTPVWKTAAKEFRAVTKNIAETGLRIGAVSASASAALGKLGARATAVTGKLAGKAAFAGLSKGVGTTAGAFGSLASSVTGASARIIPSIGGIVKHIAILGLAANAVIGAGRAIASLVTAPLKLAADAEQTAVSFKVLIGSASLAEKTLADLRKFAATTSFQLPEIQDAAKKLIGVGFSAESVTGELRKLGDIAAGLDIPLGELVNTYSKGFVKGKVNAEILNSFLEKGIPITAALAKVMGTTDTKIQDLAAKGKISFAQVQQAITNLTTGTGKFAGLMQAQSQTLGGMWSNFVDGSSDVFRQIGEMLVTELDLKGMLTKVNEWVGTVVPTIKAFVASMKVQFADWSIVGAQAINFISQEFTTWKEIVIAGWQGIVDIWTNLGGPSFTDMKDIVLDALLVGEFAFKNWRSVGELAIKSVVLGIVEWGNTLDYWLVEVVPATLSWFGQNWQEIFGKIYDSTTKILGNLGFNIYQFFANLPDLIAGNVSWDELFTPILDGVDFTFSQLPQIPERQLGEWEKTLKGDVAKLSESLGQGFAEFKGQRMDQLIPKPTWGGLVGNIADKAKGLWESSGAAGLFSGGIKPGLTQPLADGTGATEEKTAGLALRGSTEARSAIIQHQLRSLGGSNDPQKETAKNTKEATVALKQIAKSVKRGPQTLAMAPNP